MTARYPARVLADGLAGLADLANRAKVVIPELDHFALAVPDLGGDPDEMLARHGRWRGCAPLDNGQLDDHASCKATSGPVGDELEIVTGAGFGRLPAAGPRRVRLHARGRTSPSPSAAPARLRTCCGAGHHQLQPDRLEAALRPVPVHRPDQAAGHRHRRRAPPARRRHRLPAAKYHVAHIGTWGQMGLKETDGRTRRAPAGALEDARPADRRQPRRAGQPGASGPS